MTVGLRVAAGLITRNSWAGALLPTRRRNDVIANAGRAVAEGKLSRDDAGLEMTRAFATSTLRTASLCRRPPPNKWFHAPLRPSPPTPVGGEREPFAIALKNPRRLQR